jgi:phosphonate transport system ATP-binding protein
MKDNKTAISFKGVDLIYPNGYHALHDISFDVKEGEFVALIGPSGAGKTTILSAVPVMNKINKGQVDVGQYYIGKKSKKKHIKKIRNLTGFIFQHKNVVLEQTVYQNVATGYKRRTFAQNKAGTHMCKENKFKLPYRYIHAEPPHRPEGNKFIYVVTSMVANIRIGFINRVRGYNKVRDISRILETVGLTSLAYEKVKNLSGGQEQRVALARALIANPKLILADEPVSALDVINQEKVMSYLYSSAKDRNIAVVINLHHVDLAIKYADKIIGLNDGRIV